jgi:hypothetical protein
MRRKMKQGSDEEENEAGKNKCDEEENIISSILILYNLFLGHVDSALPFSPTDSPASVNLTVADSSTVMLEAGHSCRTVVNLHQATLRYISVLESII